MCLSHPAFRNVQGCDAQECNSKCSHFHMVKKNLSPNKGQHPQVILTASTFRVAEVFDLDTFLLFPFHEQGWKTAPMFASAFSFSLFQDPGVVHSTVYLEWQTPANPSALISWEELLWLPLVPCSSTGHKARAPENLPPAP